VPELRLQKARESLPSGYQFGDTATQRVVLLEPDEFIEWIPPCVDPAERGLAVMKKRYDACPRCR
jgi:hypothetical protein